MIDKKYIQGNFFIVNLEIASRTDLTLLDKFIYSFISTFWNNNLVFTASNNYIAVCMGCKRNAVINSIKRLESLKLIEIDYFKFAGKNTSRAIFKYGTKTSSESETVANINELFKRVVKTKK